MIAAWALCALSVLALGVKALFRWRTWRDRGLFLAAATALAAPLLWTGPAAVVHEMLGACSRMPGGTVLAPAAAVLIGLAGFNPFLLALLVAAALPDARLAWLCVLPMLLGNLPQTLYCAFTMPPRRRPLPPPPVAA